MNQENLFYEDETDALDAVIRALGGYKAVALTLWPTMKAESAYSRIKACLDPEKHEKLSLRELISLMKQAREIGCHVFMYYLADECAYERPKTLDPEERRAGLQREFINSVDKLNALLREIKK